METFHSIPVPVKLGFFPHKQPHWPTPCIRPSRGILYLQLDSVNEFYHLPSNHESLKPLKKRKNISTQNNHYCLIYSHEKSEVT